MDKYKANIKKQNEKAGKNTNPFVKTLKFIFVKNIGYKLLALVLSAAVFILTVGLS